MGVKEWFWSVLARGDEPELDPDELVDLTTVPFHLSELTVALLARHLIGATAVPQSRVPGRSVVDSASIRVRRADVQAAKDVLAEHG